jgi:hypothetical protein
MSVPSNTFVTGSAVGNREDLSDVIYRVDPTDTPFMSAIERETATAINHEWQTQALASASSSNAQVEGDDVASDAVTATVRRGNNVQISRKSASVSGSQRAVQHAGRDDELDYEMNLKALELKRDMETILVGTNQAKRSSDARLTASVLSWIFTNTFKNGTGSDPAAADGTGTRTDGATIAFTEINMKSVLNSIWVSGGKPDCVLLGAFNKQQFSTFTGRSTPIEQAATRRIVAAVDYYDSDFGRLQVVPDRFSRTRDVLILQTDLWAIAFLAGRRFVAFPLSKTGDADRRVVVSEYALVSRNEKGSGAVYDATSS